MAFFEQPNKTKFTEENHYFNFSSLLPSMATWKSGLLLLSVAALVAFEERISVPSCQVIGRQGEEVEGVSHRGRKGRPDDLKVMMVADLLLLGPDGGIADIYFRDSYTTKFLRKSFEKLEPDMLIVLGDISARGSNLTNNKWLRLLRQFQKMLGPFLGIPLHIILGDRDIGDCQEMDLESIRKISSNLPGLDSSGSGAFKISDVSFVSLNTVAMMCESNEVRFHVETAIESERPDLRADMINAKEKCLKKHNGSQRFEDSHSRGKNHVSSGSGPVLLIHLPLHQTSKEVENPFCGSIYLKKDTSVLSRGHQYREDVHSAPYELTQTLSLNATQYIFQALRPRIIFSAHRHHFLDQTHSDGTREVTVPAMTWAARDDPGFVLATFGQNKSVTVSHCLLAKESHVLMAYFLVFCTLLASILVMNKS